MPWIDIGANLLDGMYAGQYGGSSPRHPRDLDQVLERAWGASVAAIIITAGTKEESRKALDLACTDSRLYSTGTWYAITISNRLVPASEEVPHGYCVGHHADPVGVHPTRCSELILNGDVTHGEAYIDSLLDLCREGQRLGKVVAIGECGLDYDRLRFCDKEKQLSGFKLQFRLADATGLPMFLHNRNTGTDFMDILRENRSSFRQGVVHSFTGGPEEAAAIIDQDCYIGVNGCSLKTEEQLSTLRTIPLERILLETDAPWCEIRSTHAGAGFVKTTWPTVKKEKWEASKCVKGRQEPCHIRAVAEIVAAVLQLPLEEVERVTYENTRTVFGNLDRDT